MTSGNWRGKDYSRSKKRDSLSDWIRSDWTRLCISTGPTWSKATSSAERIGISIKDMWHGSSVGGSHMMLGLTATVRRRSSRTSQARVREGSEAQSMQHAPNGRSIGCDGWKSQIG